MDRCAVLRGSKAVLTPLHRAANGPNPPEAPLPRAAAVKMVAAEKAPKNLVFSYHPGLASAQNGDKARVARVSSCRSSSVRMSTEPSPRDMLASLKG